jgi:hypothetical protein
MDIDDFLEKESQEGAKNEDMEEEPQNDKKEAANDVLGTNYFGLWKKVAEKGIIWDEGLYDKISGEAAKAKDVIEKASLEAKQKVNSLKEDIEKAEAIIEKNDLEGASEVYARIVKIRDRISNLFLEDKKELNKRISAFYAELQNRIDSKLILQTREIMRKLEDTIKDSASDFQKGNIENAKKIFKQALQRFNSLPDLFLMEKIKLGSILLALYKDLSIHHQISMLQKQLEPGKPGKNDDYSETIDSFAKLSSLATHAPQKKNSRAAISKLRHIAGSRHRTVLLSRLIDRKLDRAKIQIAKGFFLDAKKNIESVLTLDADNREARKMLAKLTHT